MNKMRVIIIIVFFLFFRLSSYSQIKDFCVKAVLNTAKKFGVVGVKKTTKNSFKKSKVLLKNRLYTNNISSSKKVLNKYTDADLVKATGRRLGKTDYHSKEFLKRHGRETVVDILAHVQPGDINRNRLIVADYLRNPVFFNELRSKGLIKSYVELMEMSPKYRRNLDLLKRHRSGESPLVLRTINDNAGKKVNGVPFKSKVIELANGIRIKGVFPIFPKIYRTNLPDHIMLLTDKKQFDLAFMKFQNQLKRSPELRKKFNEKQLKELLNRKTNPVTNNSIPGYTWHHQENGYLDCVKTSIHNSVKHTGLRALNGGGATLR
jgi:hypothetical protein